MKFWQFVKASDAKKAVENTINHYERKLASLNEEIAHEKLRSEFLEQIAFDQNLTASDREGMKKFIETTKSIGECQEQLCKNFESFLGLVRMPVYERLKSAKNLTIDI